MIKWGDHIAVHVTKEWADAIGEITWIQYCEDEDTLTSRVFIARLVSLEHSNGLWIESATHDTEGKHVMYVPWGVILAIRTSGVSSE